VTRGVVFGIRKRGGPWAAFFYLVGLALLRLISLNTNQQLFFQPGAALLELLNLRLMINFRFAALKELDDVAVLVTKRVKALVRRH
jgi:hypothetical protein